MAVTLTALTVSLARPAFAQYPATTITVDAIANKHAIGPRIYGATLAELNAPLNHLEGNNTLRYNGKQNADNKGSDYYFDSIGNASAPPRGTRRFVRFHDGRRKCYQC